MKKHELIKKAYDDFGMGVNFISVMTQINCISIGIMVFNNSGSIFCKCKDGRYYSVYSNGKWATIVTEHEKIAVKVESEREFKRQPLILSEDGVELFEGDDYFRAGRENPNATGNYKFFEEKDLKSCHFVCSYPETDKAFSTKQAALDWIAKQPIEIQLDQDTKATIIKEKDCVVLEQDGKTIRLSLEHIALLNKQNNEPIQ